MQNQIGLAPHLARIAVGKTQWQVTEKIGVHPSLLNLIESGKRAARGAQHHKRGDHFRRLSRRPALPNE